MKEKICVNCKSFTQDFEVHSSGVCQRICEKVSSSVSCFYYEPILSQDENRNILLSLGAHWLPSDEEKKIVDAPEKKTVE